MINYTLKETSLMDGNSRYILYKDNLYGRFVNYYLNQKGNAVMSTYGVTKALQLVAGGAAQSSKKQLDDLLNPDEVGAILAANWTQSIDNIGGIWFNKILIAYGDVKNLKTSYRNFARREFNAVEIRLNDMLPRSILDEEITSASNGWLKLPQMPNIETSSIYIIALNYFSGNWKLPFDKMKSKPGIFHNQGGEKVFVTKMHINGKFQYVLADGLQIISLPFEHPSFDGVVILPEEDYRKEINIQKALSTLNKSGTEALVDLSLPRFKAEFNQSLKSGLMKAGVRDMFSLQAADFSNMAERTDNLYVSDIIHRAVIEVSEEGATAASTTVASFFGSLLPPSAEVTLNVDRTFYFVIRHSDNNQMLFIAKIASFQDA